MKFKTIIDSPCGLRFMFDNLEIQSSIGRNILLNKMMMKTSSEIEEEYSIIKKLYLLFFDKTENTNSYQKLVQKLSQLRDIYKTLENLNNSLVLDDIDLFEIKHFAFIASDIKSILQQIDFNYINLPDASKAIEILDPENLKIASFYIYDAYSEELRKLRIQLDKDKENTSLQIKTLEIESQIRQQLSKKLKPFFEDLYLLLTQLAKIDVMLAKSKQIKDLNLCFPEISKQETTYTDLYNPQIKLFLNKKGKDFQAINITFDQKACLITGANMGGKTITLKTIALCQYLFQYGFGIPAKEAKIDIKAQVSLCIGDNQSEESGLSSFASEILKINDIIENAKQGKNILALIDEPAKTTNPKEGTALVEALLDVFSQEKTSLIITTHYNIKNTNCKRLRVKGFDASKFDKIKQISDCMDYQLITDKIGEIPQDAIEIAQVLGVNKEWITKAKLY